jgi:DDE family transposase
MPTSSHPSIAKMQREVRSLLPRLSLAQANVLGEMVFAMLMVDGCGMTRMCSYLSELLGQAMNTLRQKYRELYYEKEAKAGVKQGRCKRREIVVEELFADLLRGVLRGWQGPKTLVLALDASALTDRFTVLSISVVYRGCGIRVAWTMQQGEQEGEWRPHWERMLTRLSEAVPAEWKVVVMADRGLYAPWLFRAIQAKGWHPFLRVKKALSLRAEGEVAFEAIGKRVKRTGREWKGKGEWSEKGERMQGTVFVRWEQGYEEPICVVSDLPASEAKTAWYQLRFWIEDEYKDGKRGWFHWEHTKMSKPERASRLWLVLAIAMQKAVLLGGELEAQEQEGQRKKQRHPSGKKRRPGRPVLPEKRPRGREQSVLMRGIMAMRAVETGGKKSLPQGCVRAEPLPTRLYALSRVPKSYQLKKQRREEKKRQRQRGRSKVKREQRAEAKALQQAEKLARRQEKLARREAKRAAELARRHERQGRRAAKEAGRLAGRSAKAATQQASTSVPQKPEGKPGEHWPLPPASADHQRGSGKPEPAGARAACSLVSDLPPGGGPLLRLSQGRLQPPHRPMHKEIQHKRAHGPPQEAGP